MIGNQKKTSKLTISILIPCHNEEKNIRACVDSCLAQTRLPDAIVIVNDGSTDKSASILDTYGDKITVITIPVASGNKSYAQEIGVAHITTDIFIATDGDTVLDANFVLNMESDFVADPSLAAVSGYVKSMPYNYITAFREIDYTIGQDIHKTAQAAIGFLLVIPGCAGAFNTAIFKKNIGFDHDTLTEDLDFTYKLHKQRLRIGFNKNAIVYTQDPGTLLSYINQMRRWYGGGWQNLRKHFRLAESPRAALELSLTYIDGFFFSALFFVLPFLNVTLFLGLLVINMVTLVALGAYAALKRRRLDLFLYSFLSIILTAVNAAIFLEQFFLEIILRRTNLVWFKPERRITANLDSARI